MRPITGDSATTYVAFGTKEDNETLVIHTDGDGSAIKFFVEDDNYLEITAADPVNTWQFKGTTILQSDKTAGNENATLGVASRRWDEIFLVEDPDVSSDANLKENMVTLTDGLDVISSLNPIKYNRIGSTTTKFGFTSQAVKDVMVAKGYGTDVAVYSEKYNLDTGGSTWGLKTNQLIAHLVASIKELKERIEELEGG